MAKGNTSEQNPPAAQEYLVWDSSNTSGDEAGSNLDKHFAKVSDGLLQKFLITTKGFVPTTATTKLYVTQGGSSTGGKVESVIRIEFRGWYASTAFQRPIERALQMALSQLPIPGMEQQGTPDK